MARGGGGSGGGKAGGGRQSGAPGPRGLAERVKTARRRKPSSTAWLNRQLNDPYVREAQRLGYRSRAAFKLVQIDDKFRVLAPGARVLDLGAAPGGWCQVAVQRIGPRGRVVGIDLVAVEPVAGAELLVGDATEPDAVARLRAALGGAADAVLSDMANAATGHAGTDQARTMALAEAAAEVAAELLAPGGAFVVKVLQGPDEPQLFERLRRTFAHVRRVKPKASRADSKELYLVATGFRGG